MEGCDGKDVACCDCPGADDGLGFVLEVVGLFFLGPDLRVCEDVIEDCRLA